MDRKTVYFLKKDESDEFLKYEMRKPTFGEYKKICVLYYFHIFLHVHMIFIFCSYYFYIFHKHINNHIFHKHINNHIFHKHINNHIFLHCQFHSFSYFFIKQN